MSRPHSRPSFLELLEDLTTEVTKISTERPDTSNRGLVDHSKHSSSIMNYSQKPSHHEMGNFVYDPFNISATKRFKDSSHYPTPNILPIQDHHNDQNGNFNMSRAFLPPEAYNGSAYLHSTLGKDHLQQMRVKQPSSGFGHHSLAADMNAYFPFPSSHDSKHSQATLERSNFPHHSHHSYSPPLHGPHTPPLLDHMHLASAGPHTPSPNSPTSLLRGPHTPPTVGPSTPPYSPPLAPESLPPGYTSSESDTDSSDKPPRSYSDYVTKIPDSPSHGMKKVILKKGSYSPDVINSEDISSFFNKSDMDSEEQSQYKRRNEIMPRQIFKPKKRKYNDNDDSSSLSSDSGSSSSSSDSESELGSNEKSCKSDSEPFIKYSDYEELLNLEKKRQTMEKWEPNEESCFEESENPLVDLPEDSSPILYDLPDEELSPPPLLLPTPEPPIKPKYPRYFKDKVAYTNDILGQDFLQMQPLPKGNMPCHTDDFKVSSNATNASNATKSDQIPLQKVVPAELLSETKTPLIKRLGLVGRKPPKEASPVDGYERNQTPSKSISDPDFPVVEHLEPDVIVDGKSLSPEFSLEEDTISMEEDTISIEEDTSKKPVRRLVIEENKFGRLTKVKLESPTYPTKEVKKTQHIPHKVSKNTLHTEITNVHKLLPKSSAVRSVKKSPNRPDLDSRIKIMFGMKTESPQKPEAVDSSVRYHYKNFPPLTRPPSPFRTRNLYLYWHRETHYFRKYNPVPPPGAVDSTKKRKIGIQITHQSSVASEKVSQSSDQSFVSPISSKYSSTQSSEELKAEEALTRNESDLKKRAIGSEEGAFGESMRDETEQKTLTSVGSNMALMPEECEPAITKVNVLPDNELELISSHSENEEMINLVINQIIKEFKQSLKQKVTSDVLNANSLFDEGDDKPFKIAKRE